MVQQGLSTAAYNEFSRALEVAPGLGSAHLHLGVLRYRDKSFAAAITELTAAVNSNAGGAQAHYYLGEALRETGDAEAAIRELQAAVQLQPDFPEAQNSLGVLCNVPVTSTMPSHLSSASATAAG